MKNLIRWRDVNIWSNHDGVINIVSVAVTYGDTGSQAASRQTTAWAMRLRTTQRQRRTMTMSSTIIRISVMTKRSFSALSGHDGKQMNKSLEDAHENKWLASKEQVTEIWIKYEVKVSHKTGVYRQNNVKMQRCSDVEERERCAQICTQNVCCEG